MNASARTHGVQRQKKINGIISVLRTVFFDFPNDELLSLYGVVAFGVREAEPPTRANDACHLTLNNSSVII